MRKMKSGKAAESSEVAMDLIKAMGRRGVEWTLELAQKIIEEMKMPDGWKKSELVTIYKNKGAVLKCKNHRRIKLTEHVMKVMERVTDERLRAEISISKTQFGFMKGRGTVDALYSEADAGEEIGRKRKDVLRFCRFGEGIQPGLKGGRILGTETERSVGVFD